MKFEFQVRTVLQHAWAEITHDRKYKFSGKLPRHIERKLFLYAGMLEVADKGFDEISVQIDSYVRDIEESSARGDFREEINSISLEKFIVEWARKNSYFLRPMAKDNDDFSVLVQELKQFGILTLNDLNAIIPINYAKISLDGGYDSTIYGVVRDWMLIKDWRRFIRDVSFNWIMSPDGDGDIFDKFMAADEVVEFRRTFPHDEPSYDDGLEDYGWTPDEE